MRPAETSTCFQGYRFPYRLQGNEHSAEPPLLFLGGAFQELDSWKGFVRCFQDERRVLTTDLPGSGAADALPARLGLDFLARAVEHLLDTLGIESIYLVATSYGSPVGLHLAQSRPERVARLALAGIMRQISGASRPAVEQSLLDLEASRHDAFCDAAIEALTCRDVRHHVERRISVERMLRRCLLGMSAAARRKYALNTRRLLDHEPLDPTRPVSCPTLVFTGEHDGFTRPESCREVASRIPGSYFTTIRDADHLFHLERFDVTVDLLRRFGRDRDLERVPGCSAVERPIHPPLRRAV